MGSLNIHFQLCYSYDLTMCCLSEREKHERIVHLFKIGLESIINTNSPRLSQYLQLSYWNQV